MSEQRIKVETSALRDRIRAGIQDREKTLADLADKIEQYRDEWFDEAIDATQKMLDQLQRRILPEDLGYHDNIMIKIAADYPHDPKDPAEDRELQKMRRHLNLLEMSVDKTILISPSGEYGVYLA